MSAPAEFSGPSLDDSDKDFNDLKEYLDHNNVLTCVEMAEETSGNVLLHPGLVIGDQDEHGVPEVLSVQVHRADEVVPGDPTVPQPLLVLHVVSP